MTDTVMSKYKIIKNNTNSCFVLKNNVPIQYLGELHEWLKDCDTNFYNNRWKKMWHDHVFVTDVKDILINLQVELQLIKAEFRELKELTKAKLESEQIHSGLMKNGN